MLKIGLTGGIGSGKTTVAKIFEVLGIPVFYADLVAKRLVNEDEEIRKLILLHFGPESYIKGQLNRPYISNIVFNNPKKLDLLNSITHPATIRYANEWMQKQTAPYVLKEAALIFESGSAENLNYVIGVYAPMELRIQRIMARDGLSREEIIKRMQGQINEEMKMKLCDFVITNDEQKPILPQVLALHEKLIRLSSAK